MSDYNGEITVTFSSGPKQVGRGTLKDWKDGKLQAYFDYSGKPYPTKIDMKKATGITFKPDMGKEITFSTWTYMFQSGWAAPRLLVS
jgi:hypothetical protein